MTEEFRPTVYLAAPLFSEAELAFNRNLASLLEPFVDVFLPQRDGGRLIDLVARSVSVENAYRSIFQRDIEALREADAVVILLDGRTVDEGAAFELGYAHSMHKCCVGLQTDPRRLLPLGNNPMIEGALQRLFYSTAELALWAQEFANRQSTSMNACK